MALYCDKIMLLENNFNKFLTPTLAHMWCQRPDLIDGHGKDHFFLQTSRSALPVQIEKACSIFQSADNLDTLTKMFTCIAEALFHPWKI